MLYITPTLYNAYLWYLKSEQSKEDFLKILNKEPITPTEAILKGVNFENAIMEICNTGSTDKAVGVEYDNALEFSKIVKGGYFQQALNYKITDDIFIYGKADAIKKNKIYDIKRVTQYEVGKYQDSIQHEIYMLCSGLLDFDYLISDGTYNYIESYIEPSIELLKKKVTGRILEFVNWINQDVDFKEAFNTKWVWSK